MRCSPRCGPRGTDAAARHRSTSPGSPHAGRDADAAPPGARGDASRRSWLGRAPGRLLHVNILGCAIFAAVSGSSAATAATIGRMSVPELTQRGYPERLILGTLAGSATRVC